ncbi:MAG: serine/threonine-protein kinase [Gemmatimonadales bacterium]
MLDRERFRQVDAIFDAALDRPESERAAFLDQACGDDAELRRQVEEMLASVDRAEAVLGEDAAEFASPVLSGDPTDDDPPLVAGARLGPWQVVREIGRGGMGAVYLAERADGEFELRGAVKVVKRGRDTAEILRRFRDERRILASLEHPNVARVLDGGSTADGRPYLVMEYVAGEPITAWCATRGLSDRARVEVFLPVCDAVHEAHRRLVVHRDIKPSNVLVTEQGTPKLLDFGIAKLLDPDAAATAPESSPLTPDYAAPEQLTGLPVTTATDVFGLGLLLHEVLTGTRPARVRTPERSGSIPSAVPTGPPVRGDLGRIIRRALADEPERRYGSALQLREDLERWLKGLPVLARPDSIGYRISRFVRRNAVPVAAAGVAAALLVGLVVSIISGDRRTRAALARAEQERDTAEEVTMLVEGIFAAGDPTGVGRERLDTMRVSALLDRSVARVQSGMGRRPAVQARLLRTLGDAYRGLGLLDRAEPLLRDALAAHRGLADSLALAEALNSAAMVHLDRSHPLPAESLLVEAATIYRAYGNRRPDRLHPALANLATTEAMLGRSDGRPALRRRAGPLRRRWLADTPS